MRAGCVDSRPRQPAPAPPVGPGPLETLKAGASPGRARVLRCRTGWHRPRGSASRRFDRPQTGPKRGGSVNHCNGLRAGSASWKSDLSSTSGTCLPRSSPCSGCTMSGSMRRSSRFPTASSRICSRTGKVKEISITNNYIQGELQAAQPDGRTSSSRRGSSRSLRRISSNTTSSSPASSRARSCATSRRGSSRRWSSSRSGCS